MSTHKNEKIIPFEKLADIRNRNSIKNIVHCHGVFDLFHVGHLAHLKSAKDFGDILVVTLTPDHFVNKGPGRPHYTAEQRAAMLAALEMVDYVSINKFPRANEAIRELKPNYYVKGPDYRQTQADITGGILEERDVVNSVGGSLVFTDDETKSSTELLNQYFSMWSEDQKFAIDRVKSVASCAQVVDLIHGLENLKVLVVGEPIVDTYVFTSAEGISSKSPNMSVRYLGQEDYAGGSMAIANHLAALGCQTDLLITHGDEAYFHSLLSEKMDKRVKVHAIPVKGIPTPRKTRYLVPFKTQRIFELIDLRADQWTLVDPTPFIDTLRTVESSKDITIVADFGHGMFEGAALDAIRSNRSFTALNVQTNSGNYGFNVFTKHSRYDYLSIDERECRLATQDRFTPAITLADRTVAQIVKKLASITLGTAGSAYYDNEMKRHACPTFFKEVIDTTGAGDAYFAITSLLAKQGAPSEIIPFLGNCYAGLKTRIMGNKSAVTKVDLIRCVQAILK